MTDKLYDSLVGTHTQIVDQIAEIHLAAEQLKCQPSQMVDHHGEFILAPLLVAKAQCLFGLSLLRTVYGEEDDE